MASRSLGPLRHGQRRPRLASHREWTQRVILTGRFFLGCDRKGLELFAGDSSQVPLPGLGQPRPDPGLGCDHAAQVRPIGFGTIQGALHGSTASQHPQKGVIVPGRNRIHLVVMAARAGYRGRLKCLGQGVELVIDDIVTNDVEVDATIVVDLAKPVKSCRESRLVAIIQRVAPGLGQQVTSDMFPDHLVIGNIQIESADHMIPIPPGMGQVVVPLIAMSLCEADHIEPVAGKPLAKSGRSHQTIHQGSICGVAVGLAGDGKGGHLGRAGRHARQHQACPADQGCW